MTQAWTAIDTGPTGDTVEEGFAAIIDRFDTLRSAWSGATGPASGVVGQLFLDTDDLKFYFLKTAAPDVWEKFLTGTAAVADGGTGATTASAARTNLGLGSAAVVDTGTASGNVPLTSQADARYAQLANNLSDLINAATARTNLGLGALATLSTVGASQISAAAVETAKINDLAVTNGKIANNTIAVGKLANFTASSLVASDSGGSPTTVTIASLQGSRTLLAVQDASASTSIDFTSGIDATYNRYEIQIDGLVPTTQGGDLWLRSTQNGGSTWLAGASDYRWVTEAHGGTNAWVLQQSEGDSKLVINMNDTNARLGAASGKNANFTIQITMPSSTTLTKLAIWRGNMISSVNKNVVIHGSGSLPGFATATNGIRLLPSSGTFASGRFSLFGIK